MNNVVIQLKKKYDQVDLRNYCKECKKIPFLLRNNGILYGLNESLIDYENKEVMIINNKKHVVINADNDFNYDDLLKIQEKASKTRAFITRRVTNFFIFYFLHKSDVI